MDHQAQVNTIAAAAVANMEVHQAVASIMMDTALVVANIRREALLAPLTKPAVTLKALVVNIRKEAAVPAVNIGKKAAVNIRKEAAVLAVNTKKVKVLQVPAIPRKNL